MFEVPRYFIFLFVGLSILTAYGIHRFQNYTSSSSAVSSRLPQSQLPQTEVIEELSGFSRGGEAACLCLKNSSIDSTDIQPDDETACNSDRQYLKAMLENTPALYRESRVRTPSEFPKECMIYVMKHWKREAEKKSSTSFSRCEEASGKNAVLDPSNMKPCVSRNYVNVVYNYFSDVTDCFGLSQRAWIPRLYQESGFHVSAQSPGAFGLGQLTAPVLAQANKSFALYQTFVSDSSRASCERLKSSVQKLAPVNTVTSENCSNLSRLQDPLLNLFYTSIVELQNRQQLQSYMSKPRGLRFDIFGKMAKLGLARGTYDEERLIEILALLSSQSGAGTAVVLLSNYLDAFPTVAKRALKASDLSIQGSEDKVPSFFEYVQNNQFSGKADFLNAVYEKAKDLSEQFKEGACVPESFLSL